MEQRTTKGCYNEADQTEYQVSRKLKLLLHLFLLEYLNTVLNVLGFGKLKHHCTKGEYFIFSYLCHSVW